MRKAPLHQEAFLLILATAFEQEIQMAASSSAFAGSAGAEAALTL